MANISSHVLDSVIGNHASGIRIQCFARSANGDSTLLFDKFADEQGRIAESVEPQHTSEQLELVFHSKAYFADRALPVDGYQIMKCITLRLDLPDGQGNYHLPIMLSPHSYSVWHSGAASD